MTIAQNVTNRQQSFPTQSAARFIHHARSQAKERQ